MRIAPALVLVVVACTATPPKADIVRTGTDVNASFGQTWDAVVRQFAEQNVPIRTMDRASGYIATDHLTVSDRYANLREYDCGKDAAGIPMPATDAVYNVLVRGDSTHTTVKVTARWVSVQQGQRLMMMSTSTAPVSINCSTQGGWESLFEASVKVTAEGAAHPSPYPVSKP